MCEKTAESKADVIADEFELLNSIRVFSKKTKVPVRSIVLTSKIDRINTEPDDEFGSNLDEDLYMIRREIE